MSSRNLTQSILTLILLCFCSAALGKGSSHPKAPCVYTQSKYDLLETCPKDSDDLYQKVIIWKDYYHPKVIEIRKANNLVKMEHAKKTKYVLAGIIGTGLALFAWAVVLLYSGIS